MNAAFNTQQSAFSQSDMVTVRFQLDEFQAYHEYLGSEAEC